MEELAVLCFMNMPDVVCLGETWLCMDILDMEISIPNYSIVIEIGMVVELLLH